MSETPTPDEPFHALLARLEITDYDLVLIGDGSGSKWSLPVGWSCVAVEKGHMSRRVFYGAANDGTVNVAELSAYLIPMLWYSSKVAEERNQTEDYRVRHVHVITDSDYVRQMFTEGRGSIAARNSILYMALQSVERRGYHLHWHWLPREDVALNHYADELSKAARHQFKVNDLPATLADVNQINPSC
jgi:ribonuclease HI